MCRTIKKLKKKIFVLRRYPPINIHLIYVLKAHYIMKDRDKSKIRGDLLIRLLYEVLDWTKGDISNDDEDDVSDDGIDQIKKDIETLAQFYPKALLCNHGCFRHTSHVTPLDLASYSWKTLPLSTIELMLQKGANPNKLFSLNPDAVDPEAQEKIYDTFISMGREVKKPASHVLLNLQSYTGCPDEKMKEITTLFIKYGVEKRWVPEKFQYLFEEIKEKNN